MAQKKAKRRIPKFVYNDSTPSFIVGPRPEAPGDRVKQLGTVKAALIGKLGARGYGDLLAGIKEVTEEAAA